MTPSGLRSHYNITEMLRVRRTCRDVPLRQSLTPDDMRQQFGHLTECPNVAQSGRIEVIARMSALRGKRTWPKRRRKVCL
jgi:hypothetical protein